MEQTINAKRAIIEQSITSTPQHVLALEMEKLESLAYTWILKCE